MSHAPVIVPVGTAVAPDLATNDRRVATKLLGDLGLGVAVVETTHDLHPLIKTEPVTTAASPIKITGISQTQITSGVAPQFHR
jgi:hypothetical protein